MKKKSIWIVGVLILLVGIAVMAYPILSARYAEKVRSRIHTQYQEEARQLDEKKVEKAAEEARKYNQKLFVKEISPLTVQENGYFSMLNLSSSGIMGYVSIPKIGVELPIYHGTAENVLKKGAGHMPESSLPVGGINTHAVLSAHSGMAGDPMFSDLGLLEKGDLFQIEMMGENLVYEVDQIQTVLPTEIEDIQICKGKDLVTLVTCTPYGINSHRLLVRGERISIEKDEKVQETIAETIQKESLWQSVYWNMIEYAFIFLMSLLLLMMGIGVGRYFFRRQKEQKYERK